MVTRLLFGLALLTLTAVASADNSVAWTRAALTRMPVAVSDRAPEHADAKRRQLDAIADAVAHESKSGPVSPKQWAAVLLALGWAESRFALSVHRGECRVFECDPRKLKGGAVEFQARSNWQLHANDYTRPVWDQLHGIEHTAVQVAAASKMAMVSHYRCARLKVPFPQSVFRGFSGGTCMLPTKTEGLRMGAYVRALNTPSPKTGGAS